MKANSIANIIILGLLQSTFASPLAGDNTPASGNEVAAKKSDAIIPVSGAPPSSSPVVEAPPPSLEAEKGKEQIKATKPKASKISNTEKEQKRRETMKAKELKKKEKEDKKKQENKIKIEKKVKEKIEKFERKIKELEKEGKKAAGASSPISDPNKKPETEIEPAKIDNPSPNQAAAQPGTS
ncbi:hypothetical protein K502DRAFT_361523 [Neoconidiobolus thromboides FSU 785]|nr:hypothetical protein K502DRAFT_361523 [Neoconidiobolus thromboides FSU 785]